MQAITLEQQQESEQRRAVLDERLRIARELHDVAAHHVSVIGVQAAAARRVLGRDAEAAARALTSVEQSSRSAVGEMRQLLGVLRSEPRPDGADEPSAARSPQPGIESLEALVAEARRGRSAGRARPGGPGAPDPEHRLAVAVPHGAGGAGQRAAALHRAHREDDVAAQRLRSARRGSSSRCWTTGGRVRRPPPRAVSGTWACASGLPCTTARSTSARARSAGYRVRVRYPVVADTLASSA